MNPKPPLVQQALLMNNVKSKISMVVELEKTDKPGKMAMKRMWPSLEE